MKLIITLLFFVLSFDGIAQAGYLGSLNAVEVKIGWIPVRARFNSIIDDKDGELPILSQKFKPLKSNFQVSYSRVLGRKIELGASFDFTRVTLLAGGNQTFRLSNQFGSFENFTMVNETKFNSLAASIDIKIYRKGSLAPIGKFVGFSVQFGNANVKRDNEIIYGEQGSSVSSVGNSFFERTSEFSKIDTLSDLSGTLASYVSLRGVIGRNYPLTDHLMLSFSASLPILSTYYNSITSTPGFRYFTNGQSTRVDNGNLRRVVNYSLYHYTRANFRIGVKYHI